MRKRQKHSKNKANLEFTYLDPGPPKLILNDHMGSLAGPRLGGGGLRGGALASGLACACFPAASLAAPSLAPDPPLLLGLKYFSNPSGGGLHRRKLPSADSSREAIRESVLSDRCSRCRQRDQANPTLNKTSARYKEVPSVNPTSHQGLCQPNMTSQRIWVQTDANLSKKLIAHLSRSLQKQGVIPVSYLCFPPFSQSREKATLNIY